jgi:hypothetical protein
MIPIDIFINQLIQLGLADSFLEVIEKHYLKVTKIYNIISGVNEENIKDIQLIQDLEHDSITVIIDLHNSVELVGSSDKELTVQINNEGNTVEITVTNNYESEEDIYESRFNGRRTPYTHKWS